MKLKNENLAVLIVDMQNGIIGNAFKRESVVNNINILIDQARTHNVSVIWIQHSDENLKENTEDWKLASELKYVSTDLFIRKNFGDSFEDTPLDSELKRLGVKKVFVAGAQTDGCIRATIHGAFVRGYDTTLIADAHTTEDLTSYGLPSPESIITLTNTYWTWQSAPGRQGTVIKTKDVKFEK